VRATAAWSPPSCRTACCSAAARSAPSAPDHRGRSARGRDRPRANLFYGTGIPACVWCCASARATVSGKPPSARARCCSSTPTASTSRAGRRTTCCPSTSRRSSPPSRAFARGPGLQAIVDNATLRENDYNLNIRRYADNAPAARAARRARASGGRRAQGRGGGQGRAVRAHGLDPLALFVERDANYFDFRPS
jgi:type I restriction enzyme M protein